MIVLNAVLLVASFVLMEVVAWAAHKYIMHGFLWNLHRDHHTRENQGFFERNDLFFLIFAAPGILLIHFGLQNGALDPRLWIGLGITLYGFAYVFVHDIFIHQRFRILRRTRNPYFTALRKAHHRHHKHLGREDGECFGMLWVSPGFYRTVKSQESAA